MEGLVLAEYLIVFYFLVMCLLVVGVAAIRALGCSNTCVKENTAEDIVNHANSIGPSVYNIPWQQSNCNNRPDIINIKPVSTIPQYPESTGPYYVTPKQTGYTSSPLSKGLSPIYASPIELPRSTTPVYVSLSSLGLRPKISQTPIYASPQIIGSRYSKPVLPQTSMYASPSFAGPHYSKPCLTPVPGTHYKVPQNLYSKPVQMSHCPHPRIAALKVTISCSQVCVTL